MSTQVTGLCRCNESASPRPSGRVLMTRTGAGGSLASNMRSSSLARSVSGLPSWTARHSRPTAGPPHRRCLGHEPAQLVPVQPAQTWENDEFVRHLLDPGAQEQSERVAAAGPDDLGLVAAAFGDHDLLAQPLALPRLQ